MLDGFERITNIKKKRINVQKKGKNGEREVLTIFRATMETVELSLPRRGWVLARYEPNLG